MKTREIQCNNYVCEHQCSLGKDAVFYGSCQKCGKYEPKHAAAPNRTNTRRERLSRAEKRENRMEGD